MKYFQRLLMFFYFIIFAVIAQAGADYGVIGEHSIQIGKHVTLSRKYQHYPDKWTRVNWIVQGDNPGLKIIAQDSDICTVEGVEPCTTYVICQMYYYGDISSEHYKITVEPYGKLTISADPQGGTFLYGESVNVRLSTNIPDATIYYTLDSQDPSIGSAVYTSDGITIDSNCTLKAKAVKFGYTSSRICEYYFVFSNVMPADFTSKTVEGVEMKFKITDAAAKSCVVSSFAIDRKTMGKVTIPSEANGYTVTGISYRSFYSCSHLESILIPSTIETVGEEAFMSCSNLLNIELPNSVEKMGKGAFRACTMLETVVLSKSIKRLEDYTFANCNAIKDIKGQNNIEFIGDMALPFCPWYESLPDGTNFFGKVLYEYQGEMPANTIMNVPEGCTQIFARFYDQSGLGELNIPSTVLSMRTPVCKNCPNLKTIKIDALNPVYDSRNNCNAIIETSTNALIQGCNTSIIPNNISIIGSYAFFNNNTLEDIVIPNQVDSIGHNAFQGCKNVKSILIGKGLRRIDKNVFTDMPLLKEIFVSAANPFYDSRDNCNAIIERDSNTLIVGCTGTKIPNSVRSIGAYAFYGNGNEDFTSLIIPDYVEDIQEFAFANLDNLSQIKIGPKVKSFGDRSFQCKGIRIVESLITFPEDLTHSVFWYQSTFDNATLYVPAGCRNNYRLATGWSNFKNIVEGALLVGVDDVLTPQPKEEVIYSPTGVRLSAPQRGVNIVNGRKLLVK